MGANSTRLPLLLAAYRRYLDRQDSSQYRREVERRYTSGTLQRLAGHHNREVRRAAVLAVGLICDYDANHTLGRSLLDDDRMVRTLAEEGIRTLWTRAGNEAERMELGLITRLNAAEKYVEAHLRATRLIERAPWFAEAWHQRATAYYGMGRLVEAIRDCHQTLEINPYHFVAAQQMGQVYLRLQNPVSALECFRRALRLNPDMEGVRVQIARLARIVEDRR